MKKQKLINDAGFTLMEIIAVLVILSILGVVAAPRYFDLQAKARERAFDTALAEGISRVNGYFAQQLLEYMAPGDITYNTTNLGNDLGDFTLDVTAGAHLDASAADPACPAINEAATPPITSATLVGTADMAGCIKLVVTAKTGTPAFTDNTTTDDSRAKFIPIPRGF